MNLVNLKVVSIESLPYSCVGKWCVDVKAEAYGSVSRHVLIFDTEKEAAALKIGHRFEG